MPKFLVLHDEKNVDRILLESRWTEISMDPRAEWEMTLFNLDLGRRYCEWNAPNRHVIEQILRELGIKWSDIIEVDATTASEWRVWQLESRKGMKTCWEVVNCGRQPLDTADGDAGFCPAAVDYPQTSKGPAERSYCWKAVGTSCMEKMQGTLPEETIQSAMCPFFMTAEKTDAPRLASRS